jgi:hypothetical protein
MVRFIPRILHSVTWLPGILGTTMTVELIREVALGLRGREASESGPPSVRPGGANANDGAQPAHRIRVTGHLSNLPEPLRNRLPMP